MFSHFFKFSSPLALTLAYTRVSSSQRALCVLAASSSFRDSASRTLGSAFQSQGALLARPFQLSWKFEKSMKMRDLRFNVAPCRWLANCDNRGGCPWVEGIEGSPLG